MEKLGTKSQILESSPMFLIPIRLSSEPHDDDDDDSPPPGYIPNDPDNLVPSENDGEGHDGASVSNAGIDLQTSKN